MGGRDPHELHRVATPLELLFDLTFATSFGLVASEAASVWTLGLLFVKNLMHERHGNRPFAHR
jgi:hypothetical protein